MVHNVQIWDICIQAYNINKSCTFYYTCVFDQRLRLSMKKYICQIHKCRRYRQLLLQFVSKFHWKSGMLLAINKLNIIQINASTNIYIKINSPTMRSHIGLFTFYPSYAFSLKKDKVNKYLDNIYMRYPAILIHGWMLSFCPSSYFSN